MQLQMDNWLWGHKPCATNRVLYWIADELFIHGWVCGREWGVVPHSVGGGSVWVKNRCDMADVD